MRVESGASRRLQGLPCWTEMCPCETHKATVSEKVILEGLSQVACQVSVQIIYVYGNTTFISS